MFLSQNGGVSTLQLLTLNAPSREVILGNEHQPVL
jgi:hypothetical protein